jgi:hypothetical protein
MSLNSLRRMSSLSAILSGGAIASLFLALPTGSFWPISFSNITLTFALLALPGLPTGIAFLYPLQTRIWRLGWLLAATGAIVSTLAYLLLSAIHPYPPAGRAWEAFLLGFALLGVGLLLVVVVRSASPRLRWSCLAGGTSSSSIFLSAYLLGAYPFQAVVWSAFGLSLIGLGYSATSVLGANPGPPSQTD